MFALLALLEATKVTDSRSTRWAWGDHPCQHARTGLAVIPGQ
jgi:hypothetical protein